jgi:lipopolysaccharide biosynthesis glycosyltransferase
LFNRFNSENRGIHNEKISQINQNSLLLEMLSTFEEHFKKSNQDVHKAGYEHEISIKK